MPHRAPRSPRDLALRRPVCPLRAAVGSRLPSPDALCRSHLAAAGLNLGPLSPPSDAVSGDQPAPEAQRESPRQPDGEGPAGPAGRGRPGPPGPGVQTRRDTERAPRVGSRRWLVLPAAGTGARGLGGNPLLYLEEGLGVASPGSPKLVLVTSR